MFPTFPLHGEYEEDPPYLVNPSGAQSYTVGWIRTAGQFSDVTNIVAPAPKGMFWGGVSSYSSGYQRIDLSDFPSTISLPAIDAGALNIRIDWDGLTWIQGPPTDQPKLSAKFLDAGLVELSTSTSGTKTITSATSNPNFLRDHFTDEFDIPVGTRYIDIILEMFRNTGSNNDARVDEIVIAFFPD